jgi:hypothetical protein
MKLNPIPRKKNAPVSRVCKCLILFLAFSLIFSVFIVDLSDAKTTKKASTADKRAELKESTKDQVEEAGSCASYCEIDHKVPLKCGGSNDASNLQSLPENVHKEKTSREAKLCTAEHPELTCGGLTQVTIQGFVTYICVNAKAAVSTSTSYKISKKTTSSSSTGARTCWVNGYTTKKGTQVNGYYRRC